MRTITLPSGKTITLKTYVASWKTLKTLPPDTQIANWNWFPTSACQILREIHSGIHDRINQSIPYLSRR